MTLLQTIKAYSNTFNRVITYYRKPVFIKRIPIRHNTPSKLQIMELFKYHRKIRMKRMFNIPLHSFYMMLFVVLLLLVASAFRLVLQSKHPKKNHTELKQRIQSWWWMIVILFGILLAPNTVSVVFLAILLGGLTHSSLIFINFFDVTIIYPIKLLVQITNLGLAKSKRSFVSF